MNERIGTNFVLPLRGTLKKTGHEDPIDYYYWPIIGYLYRQRISRALSLLSPPYQTILDLGYGSGLLLPTLTGLGDEIYGIDRDSDPIMVSQAMDLLNVKADLRRGDARDTGHPDGTFDLIVAISIFEHIEDIEPVLEEATRILKPGGHLLIGMPRVGRLMNFLFRLIGCSVVRDVHVTDHQKVRRAARRFLHPVADKNLPGFLPGWAGLYFCMLFQKTETP